MKWFKKDFFSWCQKPACPSCGKGKGAQEGIGQDKPTPEEQQGWASVVEVYRCKGCNHVHRFPRYNNPATLLTTRTGRCGEWANAFTLMCRAMGYEARHTLDWTDHVWTEVGEGGGVVAREGVVVGRGNGGGGWWVEGGGG